jgi:hypothetical protein
MAHEYTLVAQPKKVVAARVELSAWNTSASW